MESLLMKTKVIPMAQGNGRLEVDEYGDFQTPLPLAMQICGLLAARGELPQAVVEPTCGVGNFMMAAFQQFPDLRRGIGLEIKAEYVSVARAAFNDHEYGERVKIVKENFFDMDWRQV